MLMRPFISKYVKMRHDEVGKEVYNAIIKHNNPASQYVYPRPFWINNHIEIWLDKYIETVPKVQHNKPDIVIWNRSEKICYIVYVCIPLDKNIHAQEKRKIDTYTPLSVNLLRLYPEYT